MRISLGTRHDFLRRHAVAHDWKPLTLGHLARVFGGGTPSRDESRGEPGYVFKERATLFSASFPGALAFGSRVSDFACPRWRQLSPKAAIAAPSPFAAVRPSAKPRMRRALAERAR
jgi:hypothetical protein